MKVLPVVLLVVLVSHHAAGLLCYTCTMSGGDTDQRCITDPANVVSGSAVTNCDKKYCTIIRMEYRETGGIYSFGRGCDDRGTTGTVEDASFTSYRSACQEAKCNSGDGKDSGSGGGTGNGNDDDYIPIEGLHNDGATIASCSTLFLLLAILLRVYLLSY